MSVNASIVHWCILKVELIATTDEICSGLNRSSSRDIKRHGLLVFIVKSSYIVYTIYFNTILTA